MSRTYKHQILWRWKNYWATIPWRIGDTPDPQDINEPEYQYPQYSPMWMEVRRRKWLQTDSHRQCRHKVKSLLQQGKYVEAEYLKPRDIAYEIW